VLRTPEHNAKVVLGQVQDIEEKFASYRALLAMLAEKGALNNIKLMDLRFNGQVVTKKKQ
jgi:hypothetical protein